MSGLQYGLHTNFVKSLYFISFLWNSLFYKSLLKLRNFFYPKASHIPWNFTFRLPSLITDILLIDFQLSNGHWKTVCCHCQRTLWMTSDSHWKTVCCHCQRTLWMTGVSMTMATRFLFTCKWIWFWLQPDSSLDEDFQGPEIRQLCHQFLLEVTCDLKHGMNFLDDSLGLSGK